MSSTSPEAPVLPGKAPGPPHIRSGETVFKILAKTVLAMLPALGVSFWIFRGPAFFLACASIAAAVSAEAAGSFFFKKKARFRDAASVVAGLLFFFSLPVPSPVFAVFAAGLAGIFLARDAFGGFAGSVFHPALVAAMFLRICDPWLLRQPALVAFLPPAFLALGGIFLVWQQLAAWEIPLIYVFFYWAFRIFSGFDPGAEIISAPVLFAAFFLATDAVTGPLARRARRYYAAAGGAFAALLVPAWDAGSSFIPALLLANALTPWLDGWLKGKTAKKTG